jgi:uncharacterized iron-regulated membrane protein
MSSSITSERPGGTAGLSGANPAVPSRPRLRVGQAVRKGVFFAHLWLGLILGLYAVLVGVTGSILVFQREIDRALNPRLHYVQPAGERIPLERALESVRRAHPKLEVTGVWVSPERAAPYEFRAGTVTYTDWSVDRTGLKQVYVHPYTGEVLGVRPRFGAIFNFLFYLHRDLLLGINGAMLLRWAAIPFAVLLLSGLWLWWPAMRNFWNQARLRLTIQRRASYRRLIHDLHNVAGIYPLLILLLPVLTAAIWGFWEPVEGFVYRLTESKKQQAVVPEARPVAGPSLPLDRALAIARTRHPGAEIVSLSLGRTGKPVVVEMTIPTPQIFPPAHLRLSLDPVDGRVLHLEDERQRSQGATVMAWVLPLHIGTWGAPFGSFADLTVRALYCAAGLAPLALFATGVLKWIAKRRGRQQNRARHQRVAMRPSPSRAKPQQDSAV